MAALTRATVFLVASCGFSAVAGCAAILGIEGDYGDRAEGGGGTTLTGEGGSQAGGQGGAAGDPGGGGAGQGGSDTTSGGGGGSVSPVGVQTDSVSIAAGASSVQAAISPVDPSRTLLLFSTLFDSASPSSSQISGQLTGPAELTFARTESDGTPPIPIRYHVAEFQSGVKVLRGSTTMTTPTVAVTLPEAVDLTRSVPLLSYRNSEALHGRGDFVRAKVTGPSELSLTLPEPAASGVVDWQVVTFDGATVQSGDLTFGADDVAFTASLPKTAPPSKTWLVLSYQLDSVTGTAAELLIRGHLKGPKELTFHRSGGGAPGTLTWYAVSFGDGTRVQASTYTFGPSTSVATTPIMDVDPARSIAASGGVYQRGGTTTYSPSSNLGYGSYAIDIGAGSALTLSRGAWGGDGGDLDWFVVEFGGDGS